MTETTPTRPRAQGEGFSSGASPEDDQKRARTGQSDGEEVEADEEIESLMAEAEADERRLAERREQARIREMQKSEVLTTNLQKMQQNLDDIQPLIGPESGESLTRKQERAREAVLDLCEAGRDTARAIVRAIHDEIAPASNAQQLEAAVESAAEDAPAVVVFRDGTRVQGAARIDGMPDSLSKLDGATKNYLQKNGVSFDELLVRAGDGKRLDAPVSAKELSSLKEKVLALIALSGDNDEYSISSLKAKVADNGGKLPDCVRMLLLSGAFGPLLLAVAKGLLAEGLLDPKPRYGGVRREKDFLEEEYFRAVKACGKPESSPLARFLHLFEWDFEKQKETANEARERLRQRLGKAAAPRSIEILKPVASRRKAYAAADKDGKQCSRFIRAMLRDAMAEPGLVASWIQLLATPGLTQARVDGVLVHTLPPKIIVPGEAVFKEREAKAKAEHEARVEEALANGEEAPAYSPVGVPFRDNLSSGASDASGLYRGDLITESAFWMKRGPGHGIPRNASSMTGGHGSSGKGKKKGGPSAHAEMRRPTKEKAPPQVVAAIHTHFVCSETTALDFCYEHLGYTRGTTNIPPSDVSMAKLRTVPAPSAANTAARLFGPDGTVGEGEIPDTFGGDGKKRGHGWGTDAGLLQLARKGFLNLNSRFTDDGYLLGDLLAAYALFFAWANADFAELREDPTRRIFPCITEVSEVAFRTRALRGWAHVAPFVDMDASNFDFIQGSVDMTNMRSTTRFFRRVVEAMWVHSTDDESKAQLRARRIIMGDFEVSRRVQADFARYVPNPADDAASKKLKSFDDATRTIVPLVVEGVAKIAGLDHGLPDANKLNEHLVRSFGKSDSELQQNVYYMNLLRVSQKETLTNPDRHGFCSQLELFQQVAARDGDNWERGLFVARDLSRIEPKALEHAWVLAPELPGCVPFVPREVHVRLETTSLVAAPGAAITHKTQNVPRDSDVVVVRVAYASRLSLEMLVELRKNKVVGVDAFDLRPLVQNLPCLRLAAQGRLATAIDVREGRPGFAVLSAILNFGEAAVTDLNILRQFGMLAVLEEKNELDEETKKKRLGRIASNAARTVTQYKDIVYPAFSGAAPRPTPRPTSVNASKVYVAHRLSTDGQTFKAQDMATKLAGFADTAERVRLQPFGARESLDKLEEDDKKKVLAACAWASTSRLAIRGVLENAREKDLYLSSSDIAVAADFGKIDKGWIVDDSRGGNGANALSASLNLQDDYVYNFMLALRAVGYHFDRVLKAVLVSRSRAYDREDVDFD